MKRWAQNLTPVGVVVGAIALALSLTPSLLPRPAALMGFGSGLIFGLGYAAGAGLSSLFGRLTTWRPPATARRWLRIIGWPAYGVVLVLAGIGGVVAQNEVRRMVELAPLDDLNILGYVLALAATASACLGIGHLVRASRRRSITRMVAAGRSHAMASRKATLRSVVIVAASVLIVVIGLYVAIDWRFAAANGSPNPGLVAPSSTYRSAGEGSAVNWNQLGRHGSDFVAGGPTADDITAVTGHPAMTPVRVYVGTGAGGTLADRAATAVRELRRTGGFERRVLVVATTTGSGWLEPQAVDAVEYLHSGDTAIVALQYAHTPSFVTALADPNLPTETSAALFTAVRAYWLTLPADRRPQLVVYGLSLGAQGVMNSFGTLDSMVERTDGALIVGPTNLTPMWRTLTDERDAGSPPWQPVFDGGRQVRWASGFGDFSSVPGPWDSPRVAILQHSTDPVTWLSPELFFQRPEWLEDANRAPDVSPSMHWIPIVTGLQVLTDTVMSVAVPARHGHAFGDVMLQGWIAVTGDGGLDQDALTRVQRILEAYWAIPPFEQ